MVNSILLSSSVYLESVEQLIKNLEKQTLNVDNLEDILNDDNRQEIITKSFSSISLNTIPIDDISITFPNNDENFSINNFLTQCDNQDGEFTWDNRYDTHANYRLNLKTDKSQPIDSKSRRQKPSSTYSDDDILSNVANHMNNWSMPSSFEQLINKSEQIRSQSNLLPPSSCQQQISNHNHSSESSSTSWRQMKECQRTTTEIETKETRTPSPLNLYKIFQQKSNTTTSSSSRNVLQLYRQQNESIVSNHTKEINDQAVQTSILLDNQSQPTTIITGTLKDH